MRGYKRAGNTAGIILLQGAQLNSLMCYEDTYTTFTSLLYSSIVELELELKMAPTRLQF